MAEKYSAWRRKRIQKKARGAGGGLGESAAKKEEAKSAKGKLGAALGQRKSCLAEGETFSVSKHRRKRIW
jgi:hypothetical protein